MIKSKLIFGILLFIFISMISSCSAIISKMYGVKQIAGVDEEEIQLFYSNFDFKDIQTNRFVVDSSTFQLTREHELDSIKKDLSQPIQIHYFQNEILASFHANCYAKGSFKNLDWNYENRFESFIPNSAVDDLNAYPSLQRLNKTIPGFTPSKKKEIVIVVLWTRLLEDISEDAIKTVLNNLSKFDKENEAQLVLINTDAFFSKM